MAEIWLATGKGGRRPRALDGGRVGGFPYCWVSFFIIFLDFLLAFSFLKINIIVISYIVLEK